MKKDWIIILSRTQDGNYVDSLINKEQHNGLEAIGDTTDEANESTPMDSENDQDDQPAEEKVPEEKTPKDDQIEDESPEEEEDVKQKSEVTDGEDQPDETGDEPEEDEAGENPDDEQVDDINNEDQEKIDNSEDPHFLQNRRILLSNKLLKLYDSIKESMDIIANGPAFENKPVMLEELGELASNVQMINESINKEADHKVLLLKYALCVKTYNRIVGM